LKQAVKMSSDDPKTMFVKNLPFDTTEDMVRELFPDVVNVRMPTRSDGNIKGFAFLEFSSEEEVQTLVEDKQGCELDGNTLTLDFVGDRSKFGTRRSRGGEGSRPYRSSGPREKTKVLFVKNLSYKLSEDELQDAFDGSSSARIATFQDTGRSRGFGFVEFNNIEDAELALDRMQGQELDGREIYVDFASESRDGGGSGGGGFRRGGRGGSRGYGRGGRGGFRPRRDW